MNKNNPGVLVFIKNPFIGDVKSRLSKGFDRNLTPVLYQKFVEDILNMLKRVKLPILICYHPPDNKKEFQKWLGNDYQYLPQLGNDLGERLRNCFDLGFKLGFDKLIVIGSDSPDLPDRIIKTAVEKLNDYDIVIGPCEDGGYYIIGFTNHSFFPDVFKGIMWSTSTVFKKTVKVLESKDKHFFILEKWCDVDTIEDLKNLYNRNLKTGFNSSKTMKFLMENMDKIKQ
jgi:rSAM/selenodomain-associated transferase 1